MHHQVQLYITDIQNRKPYLTEPGLFCNSGIILNDMNLEDSDIIPLIEAMIDPNHLEFTKNIRHLSLNNNSLEKVDLSKLQWLLSLQIANNNLIEFKPPRGGLQYLNLSNNAIEKLYLSNNHYLQCALLDFNKLKFLDVHNITFLELLSLSNNENLESVVLPNDIRRYGSCTVLLANTHLNGENIIALEKLSKDNPNFLIEFGDDKPDFTKYDISFAITTVKYNYFFAKKLEFQEIAGRFSG